MSSPGWTLPAVASADTYDTVRVTELLLRFPVDAPIGGFLIVKRMRNGQDVAEHRVVLGDADTVLPPAVLQSVLAWVRPILAARALLTPGATPTTIAASAPPPVATPMLGPVL